MAGRPPKSTTPQAPAFKPERLDVFTITPSTDGSNKSFWTKLGSAWKNRDGSINVTLVGFPVNGQLQLRVPQPSQYGQYNNTPQPPPIPHNNEDNSSDVDDDDGIPF